MRRWVLETARTAAGLLAGAYLVYLPLAGWSPVPFGLILVQLGMVAWYRWGELTVPRQPLDDPALVAAVGQIAGLAGVAAPAVAVVEAEAGEFTVPAVLNRGGVVVFTRGELARHGLSHHLIVAARQIAVGQAPPEYSWRGLLATGASLGALLVVRAGDPGSLWRGLVAGMGLLALVVVIVALSTNPSELGERRIDDRARELAGLARDRHPELFSDLTARQGLGVAVSPAEAAAQPRACDHGASAR